MVNESSGPRLRLPIIIFASIMLLALYLRLLVVSESQVHIPLRADAGQYISYAYNLKFHGTYAATDSWRTGAAPIVDNLRNPGYSLLLIPFLDLKISAGNLYLITVMQAIMSTLSVVLVYFTMRRFFNLCPSGNLNVLIFIKFPAIFDRIAW
jgi:hypothetical protein